MKVSNLGIIEFIFNFILKHGCFLDIVIMQVVQKMLLVKRR